MERKAREEQNITQAPFELLLEELANLRVEKIAVYGESRYAEPPQDNMTLTWSDIHRKYIRIKHITKELANTPMPWPQDKVKALRDAFMDIASYGLMGAQILDKETTDAN